jgi:hypothetical protein
MSRRLAICIVLLVAVVAAPRPSAQAPRNLALLIGIDDYIAVRDLKGAGNDVERVRSLLIGRFGFAESDIAMLKDAQATRQGILDAFDALVAKARAGDVVYVHYSGHGSRMRDARAPEGDEEDGWDETLVPHDSRQGKVFDITDDEVNAFVTSLTAKTNNVTIVLDSCHSGSATRGGSEGRRVPDDEREPPVAAETRAVQEGPTDFGARALDYVLITGSMPHELSNEFDVAGVRQGALTHFLTAAMMSARPQTTYKTLMETVAAEVTSLFGSQHPQTEGRTDRVLFGIAQVVTRPYLLTNPKGAIALVDGGTVHGLAAGSELDVYAPGTSDFDEAVPVAKIRLRSGVDGLRSEADVISGAAIPRASRAVLRSRTYPDARLRVYLVPPDTPTMTQLRAGLANFPGFEIVTDERLADLRVKHDGRFIFTHSGDLVQLSPPIPADDPTIVRRVVERVSDWMKWFAILRLQNPDAPLSVSLKIGDGTRTRLTSGEEVAITVSNLSTQPVFILMLNLDVDGAVATLPHAAGGDLLPPSQSRVWRVRFDTTAGRVFVSDVIKVIASTVRLDPSHFAQPAARSADPPVSANDPLNRLMAATAVGQSRAATVVAVRDWGTVAQRVETWQKAVTGPVDSSGLPQAPRLDAYVLHFPEGARMDPATVASRGLDNCGTGPQPDQCWEITPMGPSSSDIEVRPAGRSADSRAPLTLGAAWDEAERIRQQTGAEFVEPVFEVAIDDQAVDTTRSGGGTPDKPAALKDTEWSLKHVDAAGARSRLRSELNRPQDAEATGVIVAHPDTGYRQHAEFWNPDVTRSAILFESGWNFVEDNPRPLDPLADGGLLPNPGHGTKSGSVIVSPPGKQWTGGQPNEFVTGAGPGARLVPLRVHTSVVHFNPSRLAKAINHAAEPDGKTIRLPQGERISVISISMGGLPSLGLYKAVKNAEKRGVILVAAAGNNVKMVVWPARFSSAVALGATDVECGTWPAGSRGGAVDFSAPGESVWRAGVTADGNESAGVGQGTTYATATTAGIAALWVSRHRGTPLFEQLRRDGLLTDAFREAVQKTVWRPGGSGAAAPPAGVTCVQNQWDDKKYGAGILNANRLLAEPLALPETRDLDAPVPYPLFESLVEADDPSVAASRRFEALFPGTPAATMKALDAELTTLYALDDEVRAAVQKITGPEEPAPTAYAEIRAVLQGKDVSTAMAAAARRQP